ncbi:hypothetical protein ACFLSY_06800 [Bacteroidota bacterium]
MKNKCLNEIEVAMMVDYLMNEVNMPEERLLLHVEECLKCKRDVLEVWTILSSF